MRSNPTRWSSPPALPSFVPSWREIHTPIHWFTWKVSTSCHHLASKWNNLTLFGPGGAHCAPPVTYLRISVQIRVGAHRKNLTFLNYEFGKGQYTFYPVKLSRFAEKNKIRWKNQIFIRGDPYEQGQTPLWRAKVSKVKHCFEGFWAFKLHESFWIWQIIPRQVISKKNWNPNPTQPKDI